MHGGRIFIVLACALAVVAAVSVADGAPEGIKMMIPANPGGGSDQTARSLGAAMQSPRLVKQVQYDNRGGAGGTIGLAQFVTSAKANPAQLMVAGLVMVGAIELQKSPVSLAQVTPIARLTAETEAIVVPAGAKIHTLDELLAQFKSNPPSVSWGGGSAGGTDHILVGLIAKAVGVEGGGRINYVPFKGGGEALQAVLGGHVTVGVSGYGEFAEQLRAGKLRVLATSGNPRNGSWTRPMVCSGGCLARSDDAAGSLPARRSDKARRPIRTRQRVRSARIHLVTPIEVAEPSKDAAFRAALSGQLLFLG
jgi:putative tricarboxylic transport membrane protein